ncbi:MAG: DUF4173 domain-containing protein [Candidatus Peribacteraceae bacterium]|nr:DUF4173 domain-containing protein [Candidatus Peribacteraceae bacterium]MBP9850246.1 DUF4173 domain-containing protein [Candidatus Peribacteraceae bacterium]
MTPEPSVTRGFLPSIIVAGMSLVLAVFFEYFVFGHELGIGFPLFVLLFLAGGFLLLRKRRYDPEILWVLVPLLFFSWMVFVRASELLTVLNILATFLLTLLLADLVTGKKLRSYVLGQYADIIVLPLRFFAPLAATLTDIASLKGVHRHSAIVSQVVKGIVMAIPVLVVFAFLFYSADLLFAKYVSSILTLDLSEETIFLIVRLVIVTCALIGGFAWILHAAERKAVVASGKPPLTIGIIEVSIFLGAINVLFLAFILIQLVYLFGGAENITSQGFTYAEYARKGFFELIIVAVFSFLILWKIEQSILRKEAVRHSGIFKIFSGILVCEVLLIMASAFTRLSLYEDAYGFTTLRLYSHAFIILLSVIFLILLYKIFVDAREYTFAHRLFLAGCAFLVVMNLLNPDAFIARQNIRHFADNPAKLDIYYLSMLSEDALPVTIDLLTSQDVSRIQYGRIYEWQDKVGPWQSMNIARLRAKELLGTKQN